MATSSLDLTDGVPRCPSPVLKHSATSHEVIQRVRTLHRGVLGKTFSIVRRPESQRMSPVASPCCFWLMLLPNRAPWREIMRPQRWLAERFVAFVLAGCAPVAGRAKFGTERSLSARRAPRYQRYALN
jgi:hypothetical protein